ncbi:hypothetical protein [Methylomonas fluvii]|nr:hypothetical protein [Methylomonas fluvii]
MYESQRQVVASIEFVLTLMLLDIDGARDLRRNWYVIQEMGALMRKLDTPQNDGMSRRELIAKWIRFVHKQ